MPALAYLLLLSILLTLTAGCLGSGGPGAASAFAPDAATATAAARSAQPELIRPVDPAAVVLDGSALLAGYDPRQRVALDPSTIGPYYQRFPNVETVLRGFGWEVGQAVTFVRRSSGQVPATVTLQVDRFSTAAGAARYLDGLRRNGSPSLSHFLDLAQPAQIVHQPTVGSASVALAAGLIDRGITPQVVPVRYYAFQRDNLIGQVTVVRDGPGWPEILGLAREQDTRIAAG